MSSSCFVSAWNENLRAGVRRWAGGLDGKQRQLHAARTIRSRRRRRRGGGIGRGGVKSGRECGRDHGSEARKDARRCGLWAAGPAAWLRGGNSERGRGAFAGCPCFAQLLRFKRRARTGTWRTRDHKHPRTHAMTWPRPFVVTLSHSFPWCCFVCGPKHFFGSDKRGRGPL